jgi:DHA1 family bicyclomycin/chloramphenicol resistance-like MFS transporter
MSPPRALPAHRTLVALIGFYLMLQPLATDFYLASLPGIARSFGASAASVQWTLSIFALAFGAMHLAAGPLTDRYGRRPVLVAGLALYAGASIACAAAPSIGMLVAGRFAQAVGCCAAVVVARAIVRDAYEPHEGAQTMAQAATVLAAGPLLGPVVGSLLEVRFGFRAVFVVVAAMALALLAATLRTLGETARQLDPEATRPKSVVANYAAVLRSPRFRAHTLVGAASYGGLFAWLSGSPLVLIEALGVPTSWFGACFAIGATGYLTGTLVCRRLLAVRGMTGTMQVGAALALGGGMALAALAAAGVRHWAAVLAPQFAFLVAHGILFPCAQTGAIAPFDRRAGAAAGLFGFLLMVVASLVGAWIGASWNGTTRPLAFTVAACGVAVFAAVHLGVVRPARAR